ncbi:hypothetical protein OPT61_g6948 [Boeremia exigua]|uniref:Uncharacterized protein n=1 Tax=Boeremia exigua TaxID=749465 RepID=A0ACC2I451_9PLEO|nr:hypothetical protein OPT61_g6948 [Boeremia exigua]
MGWISRQKPTPPTPTPLRFKHVLAGIGLFLLLCGCIACFPLTILFVPKPELTEYVPKGLHCATCEEIWLHNRDLFNRKDMSCYGPPTFNRPTTKEEEVMFAGEKRCWALKDGHDLWMRPLQVTDEETEKWEKQT